MDDVRLKEIGLQIALLAMQVADIDERIRSLKDELGITSDAEVLPFPDRPTTVKDDDGASD